MTNYLERLQSSDPKLFDVVMNSTDEKRMKAAVDACDLALRRSAPGDTAVRQMLRRLASGESLPQNDIDSLCNHRDKVDAHYAELRRAFEEDDQGTLEGYTAEFYRYLAISAVELLAEDRSPRGIANVIYEAFAPIGGDALVEARTRALATLR